jgi:protein-disulfide isomerase
MIRTPYDDYAGVQAVLALPVSPLRDHIQGPVDAPVQLVEYGDYECPYCGAAYPNVKAVQAEMGDQLAFVYRHFPLVNVHPHAEPAAESAEAAGAQGRFWPMHDLLFQNQRALDVEHLLQYAKAAGVDVARFAREVADRVHLPKVREDFETGVASGVQGTPTFFVNGVHYTGSYEAPALLTALQEAMP